MKIFNKVNPLIAALVVAVLVAGLLFVFWPSSDKKYIVADFPRTVSLYEGSDVKILGVPVGKVETVVPEGTKVQGQALLRRQVQDPGRREGRGHLALGRR